MNGKNVIFGAVTVLLICVIGLCAGGTVKGQSRAAEYESRYRVMESGLLSDTRQYLGRTGYTNSGVTLTRVVDETGYREYTFTVHHGKIDRMGEGEREKLRGELEDFCRQAGKDFPEESCTFRVEFLVQPTR